MVEDALGVERTVLQRSCLKAFEASRSEYQIYVACSRSRSREKWLQVLVKFDFDDEFAIG